MRVREHLAQDSNYVYTLQVELDNEQENLYQDQNESDEDEKEDEQLIAMRTQHLSKKMHHKMAVILRYASSSLQGLSIHSTFELPPIVVPQLRKLKKLTKIVENPN